MRIIDLLKENRITIGIIISVIVIVIIIIFGILGDFNKMSITQFGDITLGTDSTEVLFLRGKPDYKFDNGKKVWGYYLSNYYRDNDRLEVWFENSKVTRIIYLGYTFDKQPIIEGRKLVGYSLQSLKDWLGEPSGISISKDQLNRIYTFSNPNLIFIMKQNRVSAYGIYDARYGSLVFKDK